MKNKEAEYQEIFLAEAINNYEEINRLLTQLEKNFKDKNIINAIFRITHTLKGNAAGMGYTGIAEISHVLEDLFGEVRDGRIELSEQLFSSIFKGVDALGSLIDAIKSNKDVKYKGIMTKLEVLIKHAQQSTAAGGAMQTPEENDQRVAEPSPFGPENEITMSAAEQTEAEAPGEADTKLAFSDLVQVPVQKLDNLLNLVGELIIEKDRILASQSSQGLKSSNEYARLSRISSDLQYSVMDVRMVQVGFLFNKFHRVVRDAANLEKKNVVLKLEGTDTEIDRNVLQVISDSLIHLIRNCVGHGIETPEERASAGKTSEGTVWLRAKNDTDAVVIEIEDDGKGLNYEKIRAKAIAKGLIPEEVASKLDNEELSMLIFEAGFSTSDQVNAISGRGVGMDVVKKTLDSIAGNIQIKSNPGKGTLIQLTLPSSMAVKSCLLLELKKEVYAIPLSYTHSVISVYKQDLHKAGGGLVTSHLGKNIAVVFLNDIFHQNLEEISDVNLLQRSFENIHDEAKLEIVVVSFNNRTVGFVVDKLLQQKEIVEKPLMKPVDRIKFIGGVTILGSGKVCLVLNIPFILNFIFNFSLQGRSSKTLTYN